MTLIVGTNYFDYYNEQRNFLHLPFDDVEFIEVKDVFRIINHATFRIRGSFYEPFRFLFWPWKITNAGRAASLHHLFNGVSLGSTPWITTFEATAPRLEPAPKKIFDMAIERLAGAACKAIIAISQTAFLEQTRFLERCYPEYAEKIGKKLQVVHPPQKLLVPQFLTRETGDLIRFVIIGGEFFRKGGDAVLSTFDRLLEEGLPLHLTIISPMYRDSISRSTRDDLGRAYEIIRSHPGRIVHHLKIPNSRVLEILCETHVGLLPARHENYGYSVLESQAAGCPVISTDVGALREINNDAAGWVIPIADIWDYETPESRAKTSRRIEESLERIIREICAAPDIIAEKGRRAWERIRDEHDPFRTAAKIRRVYEQALES